MTDIVELIDRARKAAASDRKWTTAPPRDALLDELAAALEKAIRERDDAISARSGHHRAANRAVRRLVAERERNGRNAS